MFLRTELAYKNLALISSQLLILLILLEYYLLSPCALATFSIALFTSSSYIHESLSIFSFLSEISLFFSQDFFP